MRHFKHLLHLVLAGVMFTSVAAGEDRLRRTKTLDEIKELVFDVVSASPDDDRIMATTRDDISTFIIDDYCQVDLDGDGSDEIIVAIGFGGRTANYIMAVHEQSPLKSFWLMRSIDDIHRLDDEVMDLDGDGHYEIIANIVEYPAMSSSVEGIEDLLPASLPIRRVLEIRQWSLNAGFIDVTALHRDYLEKQVITPMRDAAASIMAISRIPMTRRLRLAGEFTIMALQQRHRSGEREAGLDVVREWVASNDADLQNLAVRSLSGVEHSKQETEVLTRLERFGVDRDVRKGAGLVRASAGSSGRQQLQ